MKVIAIEHGMIDLSQSLLNEEDDIELSGVVAVDGAIVINEEHRILPLISTFLTDSQSKNKTSVGTSVTYGRNLSYILEYLMSRDAFKGFELDEAFITVTKPILEDYFKRARNIDGIGSPSLRNRDATLKTFFDNFLCKGKGMTLPLRTVNPYDDGLLTPPPKNSIVQYCDIEDVEALMLASRFERERLIVQFIFDTGVRRSEVRRVTRSHIKEAVKFKKAQFYGANKENSIAANGYVPLKILGSKGRGREVKERTTLISTATLDRISSYHSAPIYKKFARKYRTPEETPAFLNASGRAFNECNVDDLILRLNRRAIKNRTIDKKVSPHKLRHGFAYELLKSPDLGEDYLDRLVNVSKALGHSDISTTEAYTKIPVDIYRTMTDEDGAVLTKTEKMNKLTYRTKLKIKVGDKK